MGQNYQLSGQEMIQESLYRSASDSATTTVPTSAHGGVGRVLSDAASAGFL